MKLSGKIEVFKNKKGYATGIIKAFSQDKKVVAKEFVDVELKDEDVSKKLTEGKTLTLNVIEGYLNLKHVELETESFNRMVVSICTAEIISVFPEEKKTTKKATKKASK